MDVEVMIGSKKSIVMGRVIISIGVNLESRLSSLREKYRLDPESFLNLPACRFKSAGPKVSILI